MAVNLSVPPERSLLGCSTPAFFGMRPPSGVSQELLSDRAGLPLSAGKAPVSAFDKFKQLDSANPKPVQKTDSGSRY